MLNQTRSSPLLVSQWIIDMYSNSNLNYRRPCLFNHVDSLRNYQDPHENSDRYRDTAAKICFFGATKMELIRS